MKKIGPKDSMGKNFKSYLFGKLYLKGILLIGETYEKYSSGFGNFLK